MSTGNMVRDDSKPAEGEQAGGWGREIYALTERLFPLHRSITGDGVRRTLQIMGEYVPLSISEVPTGTPVFDWEIPKEWTVREAFISDSRGRHVVDLRLGPAQAGAGDAVVAGGEGIGAEVDAWLPGPPPQPFRS